MDDATRVGLALLGFVYGACAYAGFKWVWKTFFRARPLQNRPTGKNISEWLVLKRFSEYDRQLAEAYELGVLFGRMQVQCEVKGPFLRKNRLAITVLARICKWSIHRCESVDAEWVWVHMTDDSLGCDAADDNRDAGTTTFLPPGDDFDPPTDTFEPPTDWTGHEDD